LDNNTSTTSPPTMSSPRQPLNSSSAWMVVKPPISGVPEQKPVKIRRQLVRITHKI